MVPPRRPAQGCPARTDLVDRASLIVNHRTGWGVQAKDGLARGENASGQDRDLRVGKGGVEYHDLVDEPFEEFLTAAPTRVVCKVTVVDLPDQPVFIGSQRGEGQSRPALPGRFLP